MSFPCVSCSDVSYRLAETALKIGAITLNPRNPYTWASGYRMPIYNDNRLFLSLPDTRALIASGFQELIRLNNLRCEVIAGTATAGIPHATTLADRMALPLIYVRQQAKGHGLRNRIEGGDPHGAFCVLIEDLISTGSSSLEAVTMLRESGAEISACLAIFNYGFEEARISFENSKCKFFCLLNLSQLLDVAIEEKRIEKNDVALLMDWQSAPFEWGERHGFPKISR
jgi:orotate phosphoribosyltransferase